MSKQAVVWIYKRKRKKHPRQIALIRAIDTNENEKCMSAVSIRAEIYVGFIHWLYKYLKVFLAQKWLLHWMLWCILQIPEPNPRLSPHLPAAGSASTTADFFSKTNLQPKRATLSTVMLPSLVHPRPKTSWG